ncbi:MAG: hypothetical protein RLY43_635 [Bacteroidota bacterium]|jgi:FtsH-binding integral membrane protein
MNKKYKQIKIIILTALLLVSPILWIVLSNMPTSFNESQSWVYVMTFAILALAIFFAFDSNKKN